MSDGKETENSEERPELDEEELEAVSGGGKVFPKVEIHTTSSVADRLNSRAFNPQPEPPRLRRR